MDCFICSKQRNLSEFTGPVIRERGGLRLTHFPDIPDEKATRGHLLLEPVRHITDLGEMNTAEQEALGSLIAEGSRLIREHTGAEHVYLYRINDKVPHLHFHLIPRYPNTPREFWGLKITAYEGSPKIKLPEIRALSEKMKS